jgi:hypothetical protein
MRRAITAVLVAVLTVSLAGSVRADVGVGVGGHVPGTARNFSLVGHSTLAGRGMNAGLAVNGRFAYVGNRTDGSSRCGTGDPRSTCPHPRPGILVVDVADPARPAIAGEFGAQFVTGANVGQTSRELRVWPEQGLLVVMYFPCNFSLHACASGSSGSRFRFFDLRANPVNPPLVATYVPSRTPHEMFLWTDPTNPARALLYISTLTTSVNPNTSNLLVTDISRARAGVFTEVAKGNWNGLYPGASTPDNYDSDLRVHSMGLTADGRRAYLAYLRGHFLVLDTTQLATGAIPPGTMLSLNDKLLTPPANRPRWGTADGDCVEACAESHSAVKVPGRPFALTTDEVYGTYTDPSWGCPWGWARLISTGDPQRPRVVGEYRIPPNQRSFCSSAGSADRLTSYSTHNPTLTPNLALMSWHSGGVQAVDISDPVRPAQAGWYSPSPLPSVANEDPALSRGTNKVVMWSYPIVVNGLVYVVDLRNGLYILRYTGPRSAEITSLAFLEGNSNLGDAIRLDTPPGTPAEVGPAVHVIPCGQTQRAGCAVTDQGHHQHEGPEGGHH